MRIVLKLSAIFVLTSLLQWSIIQAASLSVTIERASVPTQTSPPLRSSAAYTSENSEPFNLR